MDLFATQPIIEEFFAHGVPAPGGSKSAIPIWRRDGSLVTTVRNNRLWPVFNMIDAGGERNEKWKKVVAVQAKAFMRGRQPYLGPLKVEFVFWIRRPQCHYRSGRFSDILRDDAPEHHTQAPDATKFMRSTEDACSRIIWADDSQIIRNCSEKRWAGKADPEGCAIRIVIL